MEVNKINLAEKLSKVVHYWDPKIIAELNGQLMKVVKFKGDFVWHYHELEDECFMVLEGEFEMELRDQTILIRTGELIVIPKGVEHRPVAHEEVKILLFEPVTTLNTGNQQNELTKKKLERI